MTKNSVREVVGHIWDELYPLVGINLVWVVLTVLVLPAFPALAGLFYTTNRITDGESAGIGDFFEGFKRYFIPSLKYGLINIGVYYLTIRNIQFYARYEGLGFILLQYFFLSLVILWSILQVYVFPLLIEQDEPSIRTGLQNSVVVFLKFPGRSLGFCGIILGIIIVSRFVPPLAVLISGSLSAYLSNWHTNWVLRRLGVKSSEI
jgi:uncharacterized membrane protein YesL